MRAAAALPALFSSMKLIVELMMSRVMIPTKSCQSGGFPCKHHEKDSSNPPNPQVPTRHELRESALTPPLARAMAMMAAASMTQDSGFHMKPRNLRTLLSCKHARPHTNPSWELRITLSANQATGAGKA